MREGDRGGISDQSRQEGSRGQHNWVWGATTAHKSCTTLNPTTNNAARVTHRSLLSLDRYAGTDIVLDGANHVGVSVSVRDHHLQGGGAGGVEGRRQHFPLRLPAAEYEQDSRALRLGRHICDYTITTPLAAGTAVQRRTGL